MNKDEFEVFLCTILLGLFFSIINIVIYVILKVIFKILWI